jgi:hypothetical protein
MWGSMLHWSQHILVASERVGLGSDGEAEIAEFIRTRGITRCPTACVSPTQGLVAAADRAALGEYAVERERIRRAKLAARERAFGVVAAPISDVEEKVLIPEEIEI